MEKKINATPSFPKPQVTMLMAVFNAEKFLEKSLKSLTDQTLKEIQVICVDDASTDSSWQILQKYAGLDPRIEAIRLTRNSGQAHARNIALSKARGSYIGFLDSDDYLAPDALEKALCSFRADEQVDSVLLRLCYTDENGVPTSYYPMPPFKSLSGEEAFEASLVWRIHGVYLVRAEIHHQYPYDDSSRTYSDDNTTRLHYLKSRRVSCCDGTYFYRQHRESVTHRISISRFDYLAANASMKQLLLKMNVSDRLISIYENERWLNCIALYLFLFQHGKAFSNEEHHEALLKIKAVWQSIEPHRLTCSNRYKFGYWPFKWSWTMFRLQEEAYCSLRTLKEKLKKRLATHGKARTTDG